MNCWTRYGARWTAPDRPPSRASPLPHGISSERKPCIPPNQLWERACSRRGRHLQHRRRLTHRHREQARSHSNSRPDTNSAVTEKPVGAGLPAIRPAQARSAVPDPPPSRASPLPHGISSERKPCIPPNQLWERACSRRGRHLQHRRRLPPRHREQARSHSNSRPDTNSAVTE